MDSLGTEPVPSRWEAGDLSMASPTSWPKSIVFKTMKRIGSLTYCHGWFTRWCRQGWAIMYILYLGARWVDLCETAVRRLLRREEILHCHLLLLVSCFAYYSTLRWRRCGPPKRQILSELHSVITQKNVPLKISIVQKLLNRCHNEQLLNYTSYNNT
jgi:hypothetical protein